MEKSSNSLESTTIKKVIFSTVLFFFTLFLLTSCISNRKALSQWIGANQNELIEKWGDPDRVEKDGTMTVWIYDRFDGKFPGTTGTKSMSTEEDGTSQYDDAKIVKFIIGPGRNIVRYELE